MVETSVFDAPLTTSIAFGMAMITFCFMQPAGLTGCWFPVAPAAVGIPDWRLVQAADSRVYKNEYMARFAMLGNQAKTRQST